MVGPLVLITRPEDQAQDFAKAVEALGFCPLVDPLLRVVPCPMVGLAADHPPDALVLTSRHGAVADIPAEWRSVCPVFTIGAGTAQAAQRLGFSKIFVADGVFETLCALIRTNLPLTSRVLYLRGRDVRHDLPRALSGYTVDERIVYQTDAATELADETVAALGAGQVAFVTVFSPKTAQILADLLRRHGLMSACLMINLLSLSPAVLESLKDFQWRSIQIPASPDAEAMLSVLAAHR